MNITTRRVKHWFQRAKWAEWGGRFASVEQLIRQERHLPIYFLNMSLSM